MLSTAAPAEEPKVAAVTPRQMAHCLIQRIHEDRRGERTESYKDAFKACKQDLAAEADRGTTTAMNSAENSADDSQASK
jgi:hypothetical protein